MTYILRPTIPNTPQSSKTSARLPTHPSSRGLSSLFLRWCQVRRAQDPTTRGAHQRAEVQLLRNVFQWPVSVCTLHVGLELFWWLPTFHISIDLPLAAFQNTCFHISMIPLRPLQLLKQAAGISRRNLRLL